MRNPRYSLGKVTKSPHVHEAVSTLLRNMADQPEVKRVVKELQQGSLTHTFPDYFVLKMRKLVLHVLGFWPEELPAKTICPEILWAWDKATGTPTLLPCKHTSTTRSSPMTRLRTTQTHC